MVTDRTGSLWSSLLNCPPCLPDVMEKQTEASEYRLHVEAKECCLHMFMNVKCYCLSNESVCLCQHVVANKSIPIDKNCNFSCHF